MNHRYYKYEERLPFVEDSTHEFKAHKNLCVEELPRWAFIPGTMRRSRKAASRLLHVHVPYNFNLEVTIIFRTLNGFLNTGLGGILYLGILDSGIVKALSLTSHQVCDICG